MAANKLNTLRLSTHDQYNDEPIREICTKSDTDENNRHPQG